MRCVVVWNLEHEHRAAQVWLGLLYLLLPLFFGHCPAVSERLVAGQASGSGSVTEGQKWFVGIRKELQLQVAAMNMWHDSRFILSSGIANCYRCR